MSRNNVKYNIVIISIFILCIGVFLKLEKESQLCLGIPFITNEEIQQKAFYPQNLDNIVSMNGYLLPYDEEKRELYISCNVEPGMKFSELKGKIQSVLPEYDLYFIWDGYFDVLTQAVKDGYRASIFAIDPNGNFSTFGVVFTTLPIIELHGEVIGIDEREREIFSGEITVWDPTYHGTNKLSVQQSLLEWHVRGFSSQSAIKKPLKLNLKKSDGANNGLSLLGFECDDDYLLNSMWFDDLKVREKLAMDLWNEIADAKNSTLKMSNGEYCELVINGEYMGLRLMQNKIERSYLKLDNNAILLKGKNVNVGTASSPDMAYEIVFSSQNEEDTYKSIANFYYQTDFSNVNLESWIDLQLLMHLGNMIDNESYKNIYYVVECSNNGDRLSFIPWDTDMSFGIGWDDGFRYLPDNVENITYRMEYEEMIKQYPNLDQLLAERWKELRETVYSEENIIGKILKYNMEIQDSGAYKRDFNYLGWHSWGGDDTLENLENYIVKRLEILDDYYHTN